MSGKATDWLDEDTLARELRLGESAPHDIAPVLTNHILAAVQFVSTETGRPLVDRVRKLRIRVPDPTRAVYLGRWTSVIGIDLVEYWPTDDLSPEPQQLIDGDGKADVGRLDEVERGAALLSDWCLYPRAAGWPVAEGGLRVTMRQGLVPAAWPALAQACILVARDLFDGVSVMEKKSAAARLYGPYILQEDEVRC